MNKIGRRTKKIVCRFLFAPSHVLTDLIKFTFLIFPDASGRAEKFFPDRGKAEKLAGSGGEKIKPIPQEEHFLEGKQKKRYYIIYIE